MARINQILILALVLTFGLVVNSDAQTRRRKSKSRQAITPVQTQPTLYPVEPEVVSRASDDINSDNETTVSPSGKVNPDPPRSSATRPVRNNDEPTNRRNVAEEKEDRSLINLERLSLAEERAEAFRKQLSDAIEREATLRSKIEQLDYQMRPDIIQTETATIGSLRPEEVRDSRRKMLENEKTRTNDQLNRVVESRIRLEAAISNADALVDKLRARVEAETDDDNRKSSGRTSSRDSAEPDNPDN